jgi:hypothetical protein
MMSSSPGELEAPLETIMRRDAFKIATPGDKAQLSRALKKRIDFC